MVQAEGRPVTIEPDVAHVARQQDGASALAPRLLQAVVNSERNIVRATECTVANVTSRIEAIEIAGRTWNHFAWDFIEAHCLDAFLEFVGNRWAP